MGLTGGTCAKGAGDHWREVTHTLDALGRETAATQTDASDDVGNGDQVSAATYDALGSVLDRSSYVAATLTRTGSTFTLNILGQVITEAHYHTVSGTRTADATAKATFDAVGNPVDACFWKAGIAVDVCRTAGNPPANPPTTVTSTVYDARNNRVAQTTLATDGTTLSGTTLYNPDADYQPAAVYTPTKMSGGTVAAELQTTYTYETTGAVRRARLVGLATRACVTPSADHLTCSGGSTALGSDTYAYDGNDNISMVTTDNGAGAVTHWYCHGGRNELLTRRTGAECANSPVDETYTYDAAGNITTASGGGLQTTYTYVVQPSILTPILATTQTLTVTTDSAGLTTSLTGGASPWAYAYDAEGRLVSVCKSTACTGSGFDRVDYSYDGAGHRTQVRTTTAGGTVTTLETAFTGDAPAQDRVNGLVTRTYLTDETGRISRFCDPECTGTNPVYLVTWNAHGDALTVGRLDPATGGVTVANRYAYLTWGTPTTTPVNGSPDLAFRYLYVGAADVQWDNSIGQNLFYMHARTYSPVLGRFLTPDPARAGGNLYAYAGNSPVTKTDPSGLKPVTDVLVWTVERTFTGFDRWMHDYFMPFLALHYLGFIKDTGKALIVGLVAGIGWTEGLNMIEERASAFGKAQEGDRVIAKVYLNYSTWRVSVRYFYVRNHRWTYVFSKYFHTRGSARNPFACANSIQASLEDHWHDWTEQCSQGRLGDAWPRRPTPAEGWAYWRKNFRR